MINLTKKLLGAKYEKVAEKYLQRNHLKLISRNFNCNLGEIDLIMLDGDCLVFVEVRARSSQKFGHAIETVDYFKQQKIIKAAQIYLIKPPKLDYQSIRFDVIGIEDKENCIWIKNAFTID